MTEFMEAESGEAGKDTEEDVAARRKLTTPVFLHTVGRGGAGFAAGAGTCETVRERRFCGGQGARIGPKLSSRRLSH